MTSVSQKPVKRYMMDVKPELLSEWVPGQNRDPRTITAGSNYKAKWKCRKCSDVWEQRVNHRVNGVGCPACVGKKITTTNNLLYLRPDLAKDWHPTKNGGLTPDGVVPGANKKVWWLCEEGHTYACMLAGRHTKNLGCPYCYGRYATERNNLAVLDPELSLEWHPTRNGSLTPYDVTQFSNKRAWWICDKGHEWDTTINHRSNGTGCAKCINHKSSNIEIRLRNYIAENTDWVVYPEVYFDKSLSMLVGNVSIDIYVEVRGTKVAIEYDSGFHLQEDAMERDYRKTKLLLEAGYKVVRVRQIPFLDYVDPNLLQITYRYSYKDHSLNKVLKEIKEFVGQ